MAIATMTPRTLAPVQSQREVRKAGRPDCAGRDWGVGEGRGGWDDRGDRGDKGDGEGSEGSIGISFDIFGTL